MQSNGFCNVYYHHVWVPQVKYIDKVAPAQIKVVQQLYVCKIISTQHLASDIVCSVTNQSVLICIKKLTLVEL